MRRQIVFGSEFIEAELPDETHIVSPGLSLPLPAVADLEAEVQRALEEPLGSEPLVELARGAGRVTIAFDDPTVPCYAPLWPTAIPIVLETLGRAGVDRERVTLLCANALHRQFTNDELAKLIGDDLVREFAPHRLVCHDAEDPGGLEDLGTTEQGHPVEIGRLVTDSDLTVYVNASTTRGFSGGWKSICVGLSSYRSIRSHHDPDTMSMSLDRNRMHEILDAMGSVVTERLGTNRVFKIETLLANPLQVHRVVAGDVDACRQVVLDVTRVHQPPRRDLLEEKVDVVLYGVPDWSPYAVF